VAAAGTATMRDKPDIIDQKVHVLWINAGLSCDGDSVALTSATQPSIEDIALGVLPGLPQVAFHWPLIDYENGPVGVRSQLEATSEPVMVGDHAAPRAEVQAHFEAVLLSVIAADEKLFEAIAAAHSRSTRDRRVMSLTGEWFKEDWPDERSAHESWKQSPLVMEARRLRNQAAHRYMNNVVAQEGGRWKA
jgi:hypothetical protein